MELDANIHEMGKDLMRLALEMEEKGLAWADAEAVKDQLEDLRKVVLAHNMPKEGPLGLREVEALKSEAYLTHLNGLTNARRRANETKVRYVAAQVKLDALRTILSNKREMFKRGVEAA